MISDILKSDILSDKIDKKLPKNVRVFHMMIHDDLSESYFIFKLCNEFEIGDPCKISMIEIIRFLEDKNFLIFVEGNLCCDFVNAMIFEFKPKDTLFQRISLINRSSNDLSVNIFTGKLLPLSDSFHFKIGFFRFKMSEFRKIFNNMSESSFFVLFLINSMWPSKPSKNEIYRFVHGDIESTLREISNKFDINIKGSQFSKSIQHCFLNAINMNSYRFLKFASILYILLDEYYIGLSSKSCNIFNFYKISFMIDFLSNFNCQDVAFTKMMLKLNITKFSIANYFKMYSISEQQLRICMKTKTDDTQLLYMLSIQKAILFYNQSYYTEVISTFMEMPQLDVDGKEGSFQKLLLAKAYAMSEKHDNALKILEDTKKNSDVHFMSEFLKIKIIIESKKNQDIESLLYDLFNNSKKDAEDISCELAIYLFENFKFSDYIKMLPKIENLELPKDVFCEIYCMLGKIYISMAEYTKARTALLKSNDYKIKAENFKLLFDVDLCENYFVGLESKYLSINDRKLEQSVNISLAVYYYLNGNLHKTKERLEKIEITQLSKYDKARFFEISQLFYANCGDLSSLSEVVQDKVINYFGELTLVHAELLSFVGYRHRALELMDDLSKSEQLDTVQSASGIIRALIYINSEDKQSALNLLNTLNYDDENQGYVEFLKLCCSERDSLKKAKKIFKKYDNPHMLTLLDCCSNEDDLIEDKLNELPKVNMEIFMVYRYLLEYNYSIYNLQNIHFLSVKILEFSKQMLSDKIYKNLGLMKKKIPIIEKALHIKVTIDSCRNKIDAIKELFPIYTLRLFSNTKILVKGKELLCQNTILISKSLIHINNKKKMAISENDISVVFIEGERTKTINLECHTCKILN